MKWNGAESYTSHWDKSKQILFLMALISDLNHNMKVYIKYIDGVGNEKKG